MKFWFEFQKILKECGGTRKTQMVKNWYLPFMSYIYWWLWRNWNGSSNAKFVIFRRLTHSLPAFFLENIQWSDKSNYRSIFRLKVNYNGFFTRSWKMQTNNGIKLNSICGNGIFPGWVGLTRVFQGSLKGSERDSLIQCPHFWLIMSAI